MNLPMWLQYTLLTLLASVPFYWQVRRSGGANAEGFSRLFRMMMWIPALVVLGFQISSGRRLGDVGYGLGRGSFLLAAWLLPLAMEISVIALALRMQWRSLDPEVLAFEGRQALIGEKFGLLLKGRRQSLPQFGLNLLLSTLVGSLFMAFFAFGQEFGWRGYLQGQVMQVLDLGRALMVVGLAWGAWYFPLVLMGYRFPRHPGLGGFVLMPLTTIALSVVAGWLYLSSGSIWAPTLLHASVLVVGDLSAVGLGGHGEDLRVRISWLLLWVLVAILCTFFWPGL